MLWAVVMKYVLYPPPTHTPRLNILFCCCVLLCDTVILAALGTRQDKMKAENLSAAAILAFKNSYAALVRKIQQNWECWSGCGCHVFAVVQLCSLRCSEDSMRVRCMMSQLAYSCTRTSKNNGLWILFFFSGNPTWLRIGRVDSLGAKPCTCSACSALCKHLC